VVASFYLFTNLTYLPQPYAIHSSSPRVFISSVLWLFAVPKVHILAILNSGMNNENQGPPLQRTPRSRRPSSVSEEDISAGSFLLEDLSPGASETALRPSAAPNGDRGRSNTAHPESSPRTPQASVGDGMLFAIVPETSKYRLTFMKTRSQVYRPQAFPHCTTIIDVPSCKKSSTRRSSFGNYLEED
jgi:hypothetical protein